MKQEVDSIIFDLMGVVVRLSEWKLLRILGFRKVVQFLIVRRRNPVNEAFALLEQMRCEMPGEYQNEIHYKDKYLPLSLCDWQRGLLSAQECLGRIYSFIEYLDSKQQLPGLWHKKSLYMLVDALFNPDVIVGAVVINVEIVDLIHHCKAEQKQIFLLTNIDQETWRQITQRHQDVVNLFDGVVTSFASHLLKPQSEIYEHALRLFEIQPNRTLFVDDQKENVEAAVALGMQGTIFNRSSKINDLRKKVL